MKKELISVFLLLVLVGCAQEIPLPESPLIPERPVMPADKITSCSSDSECVLKPMMYCCGEKVEYVDRCYPIHQDPPQLEDCVGESSCPMIVLVEGCACEENKCVDIYKDF